MKRFIKKYSVSPADYVPTEPQTEAIPRAKLTNIQGYILHAVSDAYSVPIEDIKGKSRITHIVDARHAYFYMMRMLTPFSLSVIGKSANRDHSTVINGIRRFKLYCELYPEYKQAYVESLEILEDQLQTPINTLKHELQQP